MLKTHSGRDMAQSGSAPVLGTGGPQFESVYPDHLLFFYKRLLRQVNNIVCNASLLFNSVPILMLKIARYILIVIIGVVFCFGLWLKLTQLSTEDLSHLKTGDILFQTTNDSQTLAIIMASGSLYSHTGIVDMGSDGKPYVIEAVGPVQRVPLQQFLDQGIGDRLTVKRVKGIAPENFDKATAAAIKYLGRPYDVHFMFDKEHIYCSELVYYAFQDGMDLKLGREERAGDLNLDNFAVKKLIAQRRQSHPLCINGKEKDFPACYAAIMNQTLVTPASIAADPALKTIYTNYGLFE